MQILQMTVEDIINECKSHYNCGDCKIQEFCHANFKVKPYNWEGEGNVLLSELREQI